MTKLRQAKDDANNPNLPNLRISPQPNLRNKEVSVPLQPAELRVRIKGERPSHLLFSMREIRPDPSPQVQQLLKRQVQ